MRGRLLAVVGLALAVCAGAVRGQGLSAEEQAFLEQNLKKIIVVTPTRLDDAAVTTVFGVPIYTVKIQINDEDGGNALTTITVARVAESLVAVSQPSTDTVRPDIQKMIRSDFKLTGPAAAETLQKALDVVYPIIGGSDEQKARAFRRKGNEWTFVRGKFFDNALGFVMTTNAAGTITAVRFSLKVPS